MKSKQSRHHVPTDQPYVENINLVTGDKFMYDQPLLTDRQIKQLCIDENKSPLQKFLYILKEGQKIQKWSIFQNISYYIGNYEQAIKILVQINKNYNELVQFLSILGQGLSKYLEVEAHQLNKQLGSLFFELCFRTLDQNPNQVQDWSKVFESLAKSSNVKMEKCLQYINGSFSMNSPPQKRRVAFCMIRHLMKFSKQIRKLSCDKVLFFSKDQNAKTRSEICYVVKNIIQENQKDEQIWKIIWEYYHDKEADVREIATNIICNINYTPNFQIFIQSLSDEQSENQICKYLSFFIKTFHTYLEVERRSKSEIFSLFNRIIKSKNVQKIGLLMKNLDPDVIEILGEGQIFEDINFGMLPLKKKQVMESAIRLYLMVEDIQFKQSLKSLIFKTLKQTQYQYYGQCQNLSQIFDLKQEEDIAIYLNLCIRLLEGSKWYQLSSLLFVFRHILFYQNNYEKACSFMLKLWMSCPKFMLEDVIDKIIFLTIINKKSLQFLITIREKILNAKCWNFRRNYIIFYAIMKQTTSFEYHKFIPVLAYKNILQDKSSGVRMTLLQQIPKIYMFTDPSSASQKTIMREVVHKLEEDKDFFIREKAAKIKQQISILDKNSTWLIELYEHNRKASEVQNTLVQVANQQKKTIKTQNQIAKYTAKSKRKITGDQRKTINVGRVEMHKDISYDSIGIGGVNNNKIELPQTALISKKNNLFRCHSVKIKIPHKKA